MNMRKSPATLSNRIVIEEADKIRAELTEAKEKCKKSLKLLTEESEKKSTLTKLLQDLRKNLGRLSHPHDLSEERAKKIISLRAKVHKPKVIAQFDDSASEKVKSQQLKTREDVKSVPDQLPKEGADLKTPQQNEVLIRARLLVDVFAGQRSAEMDHALKKSKNSAAIHEVSPTEFKVLWYAKKTGGDRSLNAKKIDMGTMTIDGEPLRAFFKNRPLYFPKHGTVMPHEHETLDQLPILPYVNRILQIKHYNNDGSPPICLDHKSAPELLREQIKVSGLSAGGRAGHIMLRFNDRRFGMEFFYGKVAPDGKFLMRALRIGNPNLQFFPKSDEEEPSLGHVYIARVDSRIQYIRYDFDSQKQKLDRIEGFISFAELNIPEATPITSPAFEEAFIKAVIIPAEDYSSLPLNDMSIKEVVRYFALYKDRNMLFLQKREDGRGYALVNGGELVKNWEGVDNEPEDKPKRILFLSPKGKTGGSIEARVHEVKEECKATAIPFLHLPFDSSGGFDCDRAVEFIKDKKEQLVFILTGEGAPGGEWLKSDTGSTTEGVSLMEAAGCIASIVKKGLQLRGFDTASDRGKIVTQLGGNPRVYLYCTHADEPDRNNQTMLMRLKHYLFETIDGLGLSPLEFKASGLSVDKEPNSKQPTKYNYTKHGVKDFIKQGGEMLFFGEAKRSADTTTKIETTQVEPQKNERLIMSPGKI